MNTVNERISLLRKRMEQEGFAACVIPTGDPHMSEYIPDHWKTRAWYSGFTGSAGTLVVTLQGSGLWVDGRYYTQGQQEISGSEIQLFRGADPDCPTPSQYLRDNLPEASVVCADGRVQSVAASREMAKTLEEKGISLKDSGIATECWGNRPTPQVSPVYHLPEKFSGASMGEKLSQLKAKLKKGDAQATFLSRLDEIAWLFNLRGKDIHCNPVFLSYAYIGEKQAVLFAQTGCVGEEIRCLLEETGVALMEYDQAEAFLAGLKEPQSLLLDPKGTSRRMMEAARKNASLRVKEQASPIQLMKAVKNKTELENTYQAYIQDAVAQTEFYGWLTEELSQGRLYDEYELAGKLQDFRRQQENYLGDSFDAIIGYGSNGAIIHYSPQQGKAKKIASKGLLLNDSGGHYWQGTTDTTRTFALGPVTQEEKRDFTLCLKGVISLSTAVFKEGTTGAQLDALCRRHLWEYGLDYRHGTGHGVGYLLNVHEGPHGFGPGANQVPLQPGMTVTIEPGYYKVDSHGIRIENVVHIVEDKETEYGKFYRFETFTVMPIDTDCIDLSLLTPQEKEFLNRYHKRVLETVGPLVSARGKQWLEQKTKPV